MGKLSLCRFNLPDTTIDISSIINDYVIDGGFDYDDMGKRYIDGPYEYFYRCFEYEIIGNELIIKAYLLNTVSNSKWLIHVPHSTNGYGREFYKSLQTDLFSKLSEKNISLKSTETVKEKDKGAINILKQVFFATLPIIIITTIIVLISYFSTH